MSGSLGLDTLPALHVAAARMVTLSLWLEQRLSGKELPLVCHSMSPLERPRAACRLLQAGVATGHPQPVLSAEGCRPGHGTSFAQHVSKDCPCAACRLLQAGVEAAAAVIAAPAQALAAFAEEQSAELRDRVFDEFNSLAVIFRAPSAMFVPPMPHAPMAEEAALAPAVRLPHWVAPLQRASCDNILSWLAVC